MLKLLGWVGIGMIAIFAGYSARQGCHDVTQSWVHLTYFDVRDMRRSVAIMPQKVMERAPDSSSVPIEGIERPLAGTDLTPEQRTAMSDTMTDRTDAADRAASVARGRIKFMKTCVPCHGTTLAGNGPVAQFFIPPPDLLGAHTRGLKDGWIYSYIRHGGAIMPSYGAQVTAAEAWDLIHFLRQQQQATPR